MTANAIKMGIARVLHMTLSFTMVSTLKKVQLLITYSHLYMRVGVEVQECFAAISERCGIWEYP